MTGVDIIQYTAVTKSLNQVVLEDLLATIQVVIKYMSQNARGRVNASVLQTIAGRVVAWICDRFWAGSFKEHVGLVLDLLAQGVAHAVLRRKACLPCSYAPAKFGMPMDAAGVNAALGHFDEYDHYSSMDTTAFDANIPSVVAKMVAKVHLYYGQCLQGKRGELSLAHSKITNWEEFDRVNVELNPEVMSDMDLPASTRFPIHGRPVYESDPHTLEHYWGTYSVRNITIPSFRGPCVARDCPYIGTWALPEDGADAPNHVPDTSVESSYRVYVEAYADDVAIIIARP